ncbi:MAG: hypothetical protein GY774_24440, partial [Planctomycetes bacterium]|nr:hypothetical protein [Planctomycetota bacterium]
MPIVTLPDGKEISFPDGMGVNDIAMALMPGTPAGDFIGTLPSESGQPYNQIGKPYAIYNDLKAKRAREYTHETYQNPYEGVPESFAYGVYESPGELARLGETVGSVSLPGMVANMLGYKSGVSDWVDEQTGVNEMGYDPKGYPGRLQQAAKFGGNVVGDPLNAIPGGYLAGKFGKELGGEIVNQAVKPSMSTQGGMVGYHGSPHKFDKFDHSKMGTGEGAQAYGWGTYIAENPDTAKFYRDSIGKNNLPEEWRIIESPKGWEVVDVEGVTKSTLPTQKGAQENVGATIRVGEY